jgi:hypothetical protein
MAGADHNCTPRNVTSTGTSLRSSSPTLMSSLPKITIAAAVNNRKVYEMNLIASPSLTGSMAQELLIRENFASAASAYNEVLEYSRNDIIVLAHQDIYFPESWLSKLRSALSYLERNDPQWGVLGCFGVAADGTEYGQLYSAGLGIIGNVIDCPTVVRTLDEIVLVIRKSSGLRFDCALPGFHFYGADICLRAIQKGMRNYAFPGFCVHNTQMNPTLPPDFYECYRHFKRTWREVLPVRTSCITVSRLGIPYHIRRLREAYITYIRRTPVEVTRLSDPRSVLPEELSI